MGALSLGSLNISTIDMDGKSERLSGTFLNLSIHTWDRQGTKYIYVFRVVKLAVLS